MPRRRQPPVQGNGLDLAVAPAQAAGSTISYDTDFKAIASPVEEYSAITRGENSSASRYGRMGFDPTNIGGPGISGRYGMTNSDYEAWRPHETSSFGTARQTMIASDLAYKRHGLVRHMVDLMGDFGSQGIRICHPNKKIERFYRAWFEQVKGRERSERFLNHLYRLGNVVIRSQHAKITKTVRDEMYAATATAPELRPVVDKQPANEVPWLYTFLHPATIDIMGGALSNFNHDKQYSIKLPKRIAKLINTPEKATKIEQDIINSLPADIREAVKTNQPVMLPEDRTFVFHYKKDDWQEWADPIIGAVLLDISLYEKLKLADRVALDGAISSVRVFKIGDIANKIPPTVEAAQKLAEILQSVGSGGTCDIVWGPDLEILESTTAIYNFLGIKKYEPTLMAIYAGLGIPPTLTGVGGASGTTNNFVSLKTLVQRLEYGRDRLNEFWKEQIKIVQKAMGFRLPATIEFDLMNLGDDIAEKALLLQMADRGLISEELLQRYMYNGDNEMENVRIKREHDEREKGSRAPKGGPFTPNLTDDLKKIFAQRGVVTPSEVGLELDEREEGEVSPLEVQKEGQDKQAEINMKKAGQPQQGRPKNSKDSTKRKTKTFKPKSKAAIEIWANSAQDQIADIMNPVILAQCGKKNMRSLTAAEAEEAETAKFGVLCNLEPYTEISKESVATALTVNFKDDVFDDYESFSAQLSETFDRKLTVDERKQVQSQIYADMESEDG